MVASFASFGLVCLVLALLVCAVSPAAATPTAQDRPRPPAERHAACAVALAPAAMSALLDAQEWIAKGPLPLTRTLTVGKLDRLISSLAGEPAAAVDPEDAPSALRELETTREQLARATIDLRA